MAKDLQKNEIMQRVAESEALILIGAAKNFESILNIGMGLKGMKDLAGEVGWKTLGYKNFEDYTVTRWTMAETQAFKYLHVAERLPKNLAQKLGISSKASVERLFSLLPNDQTELNLTPEEVEKLMLLPPDEFKDEMAKITGYDRGRDGGRGPSDAKRALISRARYRDQLKKIQRLKEKYDTTLDEKDELVGEIEKMEKLIADLKRITSPDKNKNEMIQDNKALLFEVAELKKRVQIETRIENLSRVGMKHVLIAIGECQIVFNKIADIELHSHQEWVEFRVMTDTIRQLLDTCEDHVGFTMAEKSLNPKEYEEWHDGSFKYHLDKATEEMKKEYIKKDEERIDNLIEEAKKNRKKKREDSAKDTSGNT